MKFGKKIREIRVANKISKYKVRRDIKLQYSQIDAIENDENYSIETLKSYLTYLGLDITLKPLKSDDK